MFLNNLAKFFFFFFFSSTFITRARTCNQSNVYDNTAAVLVDSENKFVNKTNHCREKHTLHGNAALEHHELPNKKKKTRDKGSSPVIVAEIGVERVHVKEQSHSAAHQFPYHFSVKKKTQTKKEKADNNTDYITFRHYFFSLIIFRGILLSQRRHFDSAREL